MERNNFPAKNWKTQKFFPVICVEKINNKK